MRNYSLFIDETGTKDLKDDKSHFAYAGVITESKNIENIENEIKGIITSFFFKKIELKSRWFRLKFEKEERYLPYLKEGKNLNRFAKHYLIKS